MSKHTPEPWVVDDGIDSPENMADEIMRNAGEEHEWVAIGIEDEEGYASSVAYCHPMNSQRIVDCVNAMANIYSPAELVRAAKAALSALETPDDLTKEEMGYVIEDLAHALREVFKKENSDG